MFRPIDTLAFDTDWPVEGGRIIGLRDMRVVVTKRPEGEYPCEVVVTYVASGEITLAMRSRSTHSIYNATTLNITGLTGTGYTKRAVGTYMTVDVAVDDRPLSVDGSLPLRVLPCCVIWIPPVHDPFDGSVLPEPGTGWSKEVDQASHVVTYRGDPPTVPPADAVHLRLVNGISPVDLTISADGEGAVSVSGQVITVAPAERTLTNDGRVL